ncbi:MAG: amidohydrolase [Clostridiales bacterium]|nr:amidohydrolase [Clostridiales bacterium]
MLIDFHTHCFPDRIANRAIEKLSFAAGGLFPHTDGTISSLRDSMAKEGVDTSVVLSIATNAHQQKSVNDFAASINNQQDIFAFGSVYPYAEDALEELGRIKALGLKGVKLHPDYQSFFVDDERMKPIYQEIGRLGLITVFHAGWDYGFEPPYHCTPDRLERALNWFDSPVVAAHWGGVNCTQEVIERLCGRDVYFDVSFGYCMMPRVFAKTIVERHGAERLLFGTDSPWHTAEMELRLLNTLELSKTEMDAITHENAKKLLSL